MRAINFHLIIRITNGRMQTDEQRIFMVHRLIKHSFGVSVNSASWIGNWWMFCYTRNLFVATTYCMYQHYV